MCALWTKSKPNFTGDDGGEEEGLMFSKFSARVNEISPNRFGGEVKENKILRRNPHQKT